MGEIPARATDDVYEALDLSGICNAEAGILGEGVQGPVGACLLHGLPFQIGSRSGQGKSLIVYGDATVPPAPPSIPVNRLAQTLVIAHALLETNLFAGGPVGTLVATYTFCYADGSAETVQIRERLEIAVTPRFWKNRSLPLDWGQFPFLAFTDAAQALMPREVGRYDDAGVRQTEIYDPQSREPYVLPYTYYLWTWRNPHPERAVSHVSITPAGPRFCIAALTVGSSDEEPFARTAASTVVCTVTTGAVKDLEVLVDRGSSTYAHPLVVEESEPDAADALPAWGRQRVQPRTQAYSRVSAIPSATVTLRSGGQVLGEVAWGELRKVKAAEPRPGVRIEIVDENLCWLRTKVVDAETSEPIPCRIHFRSGRGVPYPPYGHHAHINSEMGTWNWDIGGDVRLGTTTYAYIDGTCEGWLPEGEVIVEIARGFEYTPLVERRVVKAGMTELEFRLRRFVDMAKAGYFGGDTHVHFMSTAGAAFEARGEDLRVVNLLLSQWSHLYSNVEEFTGHPHATADGATIVFAGQENRQNMLGHMGLLDLRVPVAPWCTGGAEEAELGGGIQTTLSHWADQCHAQGGLVVLSHFPCPYGEVAALIVTGRGDAIEMIVSDDYNVLEYYRYLNCGYRLPLVAGTDKMTAEVAVGTFRTYSYIPPEVPFSYRAWCNGIRSGNTFISSGPLLRFTVNGQSMGSTIFLPSAGGECEAEIEALSALPMESLQLVANGRVLAEAVSDGPANRLALKRSITVTDDTWFAARCGGARGRGGRHNDTWRRDVVAHTSPVYVTTGDAYSRYDDEGARHILTLIEGALRFIHDRSPRFWPGRVSHHHHERDHLAYLERPFLEARAAIEERIKEHSP